MTSKERAALRAKANPLEPIIQIGKEGISENLLTQIDDTLDNRELIKIRVHLESANPLRNLRKSFLSLLALRLFR